MKGVGVKGLNSDGKLVTLFPGDAGYVKNMLPALHNEVAKAISSLKSYLIEPIQPYLNGIDKATDTRNKERRRWEKEEHSFFNTPEPEQAAREVKKWCKNQMDELEAQRHSERGIIAKFNAWIPIYHSYLYTRLHLAGLQYFLGITNITRQKNSILQGLLDAEYVATVASKIIGFEKQNSVNNALDKVREKETKMFIAWLDYQRIYIDQRILKAKQEEKDTSEIEAYRDNLTTIADGMVSLGKAFGSTSDVKTVLEITFEQSNTYVKSIWNEVKDIKEIKSLRITSFVELGLKFTIDEIFNILMNEYVERAKLIESKIDTLLDVKKDIENEKTRVAYEAAIKQSAISYKTLQNSLIDRQEEYIKIGQELDTQARGNRRLRRLGLAPKSSAKEKYPTLMLQASLFMELFALDTYMWESLKENNIHGAYLKKFAETLQDTRGETPPKRRGVVEYLEIPQQEKKTLEYINKSIEKAVGETSIDREHFRDVDSQAQRLHKVLSPSGGRYTINKIDPYSY